MVMTKRSPFKCFKTSPEIIRMVASYVQYVALDAIAVLSRPVSKKPRKKTRIVLLHLLQKSLVET